MATKLWSEIDGEPWLDNPRRRRRRTKARKRGRKRSRSRTLVLANPRRRRRSRGRFVAGRNPHRRRHRYHRNPGFGGLRGIGARVVDGLKGGLAVLAGEAAASAIPKLI